jgi:hypothetical protein
MVTGRAAGEGWEAPSFIESCWRGCLWDRRLEPGKRGFTDDAVGQHGVLLQGIELREKALTPSALARPEREVLAIAKSSR